MCFRVSWLETRLEYIDDELYIHVYTYSPFLFDCLFCANYRFSWYYYSLTESCKVRRCALSIRDEPEAWLACGGRISARAKGRGHGRWQWEWQRVE